LDAKIAPQGVSIAREFAARAFVRGLELNSWDEWSDYCKSGKKPDDIPTTPSKAYANDGWTGMGDWLGNERKR
jgi:hypothetical protein